MVQTEGREKLQVQTSGEGEKGTGSQSWFHLKNLELEWCLDPPLVLDLIISVPSPAVLRAYSSVYFLYQKIIFFFLYRFFSINFHMFLSHYIFDDSFSKLASSKVDLDLSKKLDVSFQSVQSMFVQPEFVCVCVWSSNLMHKSEQIQKTNQKSNERYIHHWLSLETIVDKA